MKTRCTTIPALLLSLTALVSIPCLAKDNAANEAKSEAAVRTAETRRFEANVSADASTLGELLDEGLEYVHSNGEVDSKKSFIDSLTSGKRDYASATANIESIRIFGDTAIVRGKARVTVIDAGTSRDLHIGYTDVWLWKDGRWQMTAWRSARLPDSPVK